MGQRQSNLRLKDARCLTSIGGECVVTLYYFKTRD